MTFILLGTGNRTLIVPTIPSISLKVICKTLPKSFPENTIRSTLLIVIQVVFLMNVLRAPRSMYIESMNSTPALVYMDKMVENSLSTTEKKLMIRLLKAWLN